MTVQKFHICHYSLHPRSGTNIPSMEKLLAAPSGSLTVVTWLKLCVFIPNKMVIVTLSPDRLGREGYCAYSTMRALITLAAANSPAHIFKWRKDYIYTESKLWRDSIYMISYNLFKVSLFWVQDHQLFLVGALCLARAIFAAALDVVSATVARSSVLAGTRLRVAWFAVVLAILRRDFRAFRLGRHLPFLFCCMRSCRRRISGWSKKTAGFMALHCTLRRRRTYYKSWKIPGS